MKYKTDINQKLISCEHCGNIEEIDKKVCSNCNSKIEQRKELCYTKTLSFTLIAIIFLFPANILPMMEVNTLGQIEKSTILDGIIYFVHTKSYAIAFVIFVASIFVPIFKLFVLIFLLFVAKFNKHKFSRFAIRVYRIIKFIGKWSMLDIFVVALMIMMVQFENLSTIKAGLAAPSFTIVVVFTILATNSFDSRLLWDE